MSLHYWSKEILPKSVIDFVSIDVAGSTSHTHKTAESTKHLGRINANNELEDVETSS